MRELELIVDQKCVIGEGPCYDGREQALYWIDLLGNNIHRYNLVDQCVTNMHLQQNIGCVAVREKGGLVAALQHGYHFVDMVHETVEKICDPEEDKSENRFNDGKCDCVGRFWAGTMSKKLDTGYGEYEPAGSLYCLYGDLHAEKKLDGVILSNGIGWSPDNKTMYYIDTPTMAVAAFDYDAVSGEIANRRDVIRVPKKMGIPDGMCVDAQGMLWVALWGGGCVTRWDPNTGTMLETVDVPALNVSCCAFGGNNMDELFITTARIGTDTTQYPNAGGLFRYHPGVTGLESYTFKEE